MSRPPPPGSLGSLHESFVHEFLKIETVLVLRYCNDLPNPSHAYRAPPGTQGTPTRPRTMPLLRNSHLHSNLFTARGAGPPPHRASMGRHGASMKQRYLFPRVWAKAACRVSAEAPMSFGSAAASAALALRALASASSRGALVTPPVLSRHWPTRLRPATFASVLFFTAGLRDEVFLRRWSWRLFALRSGLVGSCARRALLRCSTKRRFGFLADHPCLLSWLLLLAVSMAMAADRAGLALAPACVSATSHGARAQLYYCRIAIAALSGCP